MTDESEPFFAISSIAYRSDGLHVYWFFVPRSFKEISLKYRVSYPDSKHGNDHVARLVSIGES